MAEMQNDNYILIPHPAHPEVLLLSEDNYWTLPRLHATEATDIHQVILTQLGLDVTVLNVVYNHFKNEREPHSIVYATENHTLSWSLPQNARWIGRARLAELSLSVPEHRSVLETWLDEVEHGDIPTARVPWARPGWFDEAKTWIEEQVTSRGYRIVAPIEQVHVRVWSTVLRVPTSSGMLYFKASGPSFAYEPALTQTLSEHWPQCIPHVIAIDKQRTWILMEDAGRPLRELLLTGEKIVNRVYLESALSLYAQFQIETAAYRDTLLSLGCPNRQLHVLPALFEQIVADTPILLVGQKGGVSEAELEQLRSFTPQVQAMCDELASYNLPETLHHDDFHTRNILINKQDYVFFDWGDSGITHPFFSMFTALRSAKYRLHYDENSLLRLLDAYLEPWRTYTSKEHLLGAFHLAQRLAILSRTLTWYQIAASLESGVIWEYDDAVPHWLRMFLTNEDPDEV